MLRGRRRLFVRILMCVREGPNTPSVSELGSARVVPDTIAGTQKFPRPDRNQGAAGECQSSPLSFSISETDGWFETKITFAVMQRHV